MEWMLVHTAEILKTELKASDLDKEDIKICKTNRRRSFIVTLLFTARIFIMFCVSVSLCGVRL